MKRTIAFFSSLLTAGLLAPATAQTVLINETDADTTGIDSLEFVELISVDASGDPVGNVALDGLVVVFFNGSDDLSYLAFGLDGQSTNEDGLFVLGNPDVNGVGLVFDPGSQGAFQNGADAVALISGSEGDYPNDTPPPTEGVLDAVVYGTADGDDFELLEALAPEGGSLIQFDEAANGLKDTQSISRQPDGGSAFSTNYSTRDATPGLLNTPTNSFTLNLGGTSVSESSGSVLSGLVSITSSLAEDLTVNLDNSDPSEILVPQTVTILAGQTSAPFDVTVLDDSWDDGDREVTVTASTTDLNISADSAFITVNDDADTDPSTFVINEVHAEVDFTPDFPEENANRVGEGDFQDEFVEIVNIGEDPLDLSGFMIADRVTVRHMFPAGTVVEAGCAIVVFGGAAEEGNPAIYGGATTQNANVTPLSGLALNDNGDSVRIIDTEGVEVLGLDYTDEQASFNDGSLTRSPDLTGDFVFHFDADDALFKISPGFKTDSLTPFCEFESLVLEFDPDTISEDGGTSTLTITREGAMTAALTVTITNGDPSEIVVQETAVIEAGSASVTVPVTAVNDDAPDGTVAVTVTVTGEGLVDGTGVISVEDDGDTLNFSIFINEIHASAPGMDRLEFVELYDGGEGNTDLSDLVFVLINGANDQVYDALDLDGFSTNAQGFFVVGTENVTSAGVQIPGGSLQNGGANGGDVVAIVFGEASNFPTSSQPPVAEATVDAVIYNGTDESLASLLGVTPFDVSPSDSSTESIQRMPDGGTLKDTSAFVAAAPTPNALNSGDPGNMGSAAFEAWATANGVSGGPDGDGDLDGMPNAAEFAIDGFSLATADALPVPVGNQISLTKSSDVMGDANTTIVVEVSTDLVTWSSSETDTNIITDDAGSLVVEYVGPTDGGRVYFRLSVTTTP